MKKTLLTLMVAFGAICITQAQEWPSFAAEEFSISYPTDWETDDSGMMGTSLILFSPANAEEESFRTNVNVIVQELGGMEITLEMIGEATISQIESMLEDVVVIENKLMDTMGKPYQFLNYTGGQGDVILYFEQHIYLEDGVLAVVTFTSTKVDADAYKATAQRILASFILN